MAPREMASDRLQKYDERKGDGRKRKEGRKKDEKRCLYPSLSLSVALERVCERERG
jgi:hypothetical protein